MATTTKQCNHCNQTKPTSDFYKRSKSPDLLQMKCKSCFKIINENFRDTNPKYQVDWQRANPVKWLAYVTNWAKINRNADNSRSAIYFCINPNKEIYVGHSQTRFSARKSAHKKDYKLNKGVIPYLHESFSKYGYDNHSWVVMDMSGMDKETLETIEYTMATQFSKLGISLNKRLK
jgi:hypothetical protein